MYPLSWTRWRTSCTRRLCSLVGRADEEVVGELELRRSAHGSAAALRSTSSCGATPSARAASATGSPCSSVPVRKNVVLAARRWWRASTSVAIAVVGVAEVRRAVDVGDRGGDVEGHRRAEATTAHGLDRRRAQRLRRSPRQRAVQPVRRHAGQLGERLGRRPWPRAGVDERAQRGERALLRVGLRAGRRRGDDEHDLAARRLALRSARRSPRRSRGAPPRAAWSARGRPRPGASGRRRRAARASPTSRCGDSNATSVSGVPSSRRSSSPRRARQEADEAPALGRQPRGDERRERRARSGQHLDREPGGDARLDEDEAGVRDQRHPGIGDERDDRAACASARPARRRARARCARGS